MYLHNCWSGTAGEFRSFTISTQYVCIALCFFYPYYVVKSLRGNLILASCFVTFHMRRIMCRFALLILLASSLTIATFSSPDSLSLDTSDSSLWSTISMDEVSSSGPIDFVPRRPLDDGVVPVSGSGDMMTPYQDQEFITEDAEQGLTGTVDLCN